MQYPNGHALYAKEKDDHILFVSLDVDDLIFTENDPKMIENFKLAMTSEFDMTNLGLMSYFLGLEVKQHEDGIFLSQKHYAKEILKKFKMEDCNPCGTPMECGAKLSMHDEVETKDSTLFKSLVGCLRYLTCTRPDILYVVGYVS